MNAPFAGKRGEAAFAQLCDELRPDLFRFAFWLARDRDVAEDVVQEALLRAWRSREALAEGAAAKPWLLTIVRREHARLYERKRFRTVQVDELIASESVELGAAVDQEVLNVRRAIFALEDDYREPLVMQVNALAGGYMVDGTIEMILPLVRQAVELGADVIKADPCDDMNEYHRVIEIAGGVPILVRGGGRVSDAVILERTEQLMGQGARGIVYGRNVIQHENPAGMTRALMAIVHDGATAAQALAMLEGSDG